MVNVEENIYLGKLGLGRIFWIFNNSLLRLPSQIVMTKISTPEQDLYLGQCFKFDETEINDQVKLQKEFSSDIGSAVAALRAISVDSSSSNADLTQLFRLSTHEAKKSRAQNRIFRVILLYCRSSTPPQFQLPTSPKIFTLDVMYLHDKPGPDNCPQTVYDTLVEALERISEYEGYIFESGQGLTRALFRHMCVLLSHPQQRCMQDDVDLPKSLTKKSSVAELAPTDDNIVVSS